MEVNRNITQEEKQLLLKDLSTRLPYETKVYWANCNYGDKVKNLVSIDEFGIVNDEFPVEECKPFLRPMSSMTEQEKRELQSFFPGSFGGQWLNLEKGYIDIYECESTTRLYLYDSIRLIEWLNKKMFDYRGLIPKGLAEIAPEGMYNYETKEEFNENSSRIVVGCKIRSKTNPPEILRIVSSDCHGDGFECSNGSVLSLETIKKHYDLYIEENKGTIVIN